jgi:hypothetical protein
LGRCTTIVTVTSLRCPPRPSPVPALAHHARPCFCTQVSHITAGGCLCLSRGVQLGERSEAGVDTNACFFLYTDIPPLDFALVDSFNTWTLGRPCLYDNSLSARRSLVSMVETRERNNVVEGGSDVRSRVDSLFWGRQRGV